MDHPLIDLIEQKIAEAEANGEFENLAGAGKPLVQEGDPENALLARVSRENGAVLPFVAMARELEALRQELRETGDRTRRTEIMKEMSMTEVKIDLARKAWSR
ncbi:DUF1992 domain-containing protein [Celeribacter arenosi]|uniref:DnaJ homologue subfamily C member 28 conserved domain-containing protein n=1 Tax=Celeribacter arenosi TaxID=792649 RepID=A0ABP7K3X4_9RHOB